MIDLIQKNKTLYIRILVSVYLVLNLSGFILSTIVDQAKTPNRTCEIKSIASIVFFGEIIGCIFVKPRFITPPPTQDL